MVSIVKRRNISKWILGGELCLAELNDLEPEFQHHQFANLPICNDGFDSEKLELAFSCAEEIQICARNWRLDFLFNESCHPTVRRPTSE
jgi:hypothetical protein